MERAKATRQIERIIGAIETNQFPVKVRELYVFGSYARGAPQVGDLDLIVIHESPQDLLAELKLELTQKHGNDVVYWPTQPPQKFEAMMRRVITRPGEKMDILYGVTLEAAIEYHSHVATSKQVLLWSDEDRDWRGKVAGIVLDENEGRLDRGHFAEVKLFRTDVSTMEQVSQAIKEQLLDLTRIPISAIDLSMLNPLYQKWNDWWQHCKAMGKNSLKLLPYGMWWVQQQPGQASIEPWPPRQSEMCTKDDRFVVHFGKPPLHSVFTVLDAAVVRERVCLIPHIKKGGDNHLLVFEKGKSYSPDRLRAIRQHLY